MRILLNSQPLLAISETLWTTNDTFNYWKPTKINCKIKIPTHPSVHHYGPWTSLCTLCIPLYGSLCSSSYFSSATLTCLFHTPSYSHLHCIHLDPFITLHNPFALLYLSISPLSHSIPPKTLVHSSCPLWLSASLHLCASLDPELPLYLSVPLSCHFCPIHASLGSIYIHLHPFQCPTRQSALLLAYQHILHIPFWFVEALSQSNMLLVFSYISCIRNLIL